MGERTSGGAEFGAGAVAQALGRAGSMCAMPGACELRRRRKIMVLVAGTLGLAAALTAAATLVPGRDGHLAQTYRPRDASVVVARVPRRAPDEVAARRALAMSPERVEIAVALA